jgi:hypothetical protein
MQDEENRQQQGFTLQSNNGSQRHVSLPSAMQEGRHTALRNVDVLSDSVIGDEVDVTNVIELPPPASQREMMILNVT